MPPARAGLLPDRLSDKQEDCEQLLKFKNAQGVLQKTVHWCQTELSEFFDFIDKSYQQNIS
jgi:hypothetical protein